MGRPRPISRPWSRTGENPPYGILGGTMETSASFEARSAPSSYPTRLAPESFSRKIFLQPAFLRACIRRSRFWSRVETRA